MLHRTLFLVLLVGGTVTAAPVRVLILTGQNNHSWSATTPVLQKILADSGRFTVDVTERPDQCTAETFAKYDVVLSNWNTFGKNAALTNWPAATKTAFRQFIRDGHGFVGVHAGTSAFYDWPEFQQLAGATWQNGVTHHNAPQQFTVQPTSVAHPVTAGLRPFTTTDELWRKSAVQPDATVLATADGEPIAVATALGNGRGFTLLLGHNAQFMANDGFAALLVRGVEWAATGKVTVPNVKTYREGASRAILAELEKMTAPELAALLASDATGDCKKAVCARLSLVGTAAEVPVLAKLLADPELGFHARFALERIPSPAALAALRAALPDVGAMNSLGARRDELAVPLLAKLLPNKAAARALAEIGSRDALAALANGPATDLLLCALNLHDAPTLEKLCAPNYPQPVRTAAFIELVRAREHGNELIVRALTGEDAVLQTAALRSLQANPKLAFPATLLPQLSALRPDLQVQLISVLAVPGNTQMLPMVTQAAASPDENVRRAAVTALGTFGDASAVPVLIGLVARADKDERKLIGEALVRLRGADVDAVLSKSAQPEAIRALVARDAKSVVPALLVLAEQGNGEAIAAVGKLADATDGPRVIALLDKPTDREVVQVALIGIYRRAQTVEPVVAAAAQAQGAKKASLVTVLGALGGPQALPALRAALRDSDRAVQMAAVRALSDWPDAAPLEDLQALAATATDEKVKALALRGVQRLTPAPTVVGKNLARGARATNPDGLKPDNAGGGPAMAIDGNPATYWDETDDQKLYQLRVQLPHPSTVHALRITGFQQHHYAPKDFAIVCDDKPVKTVTGATYTDNVVTVELPATSCTTIQLNITGYYGKSPAIRELEILGEEK